MTQLGRCALCLQPGQVLQDSHLIPRAVYELCRTPGLKNSHPVVVTREVVLQAPHQISDYLLCRKCEERFNSRGENWVLARLARDGVSPLYDALSRLQPVTTYGGDALYATLNCADIDTEKLVYFAMSVFWKASVRSWTHLRAEIGIRLGKYEEPLRKWLMDEDSFPRNMVIMICIPPTSKAFAGTYGPRGWKNLPYHVYRFYVPGIEFTLCVGRQIPKDVVATCSQNSSENFVFSSPDVVKNAKDAFRYLRRESRVSPKLKVSLEQFRATKRIK
jgi:hypothetical protein